MRSLPIIAAFLLVSSLCVQAVNDITNTRPLISVIYNEPITLESLNATLFYEEDDLLVPLQFLNYTYLSRTAYYTPTVELFPGRYSFTIDAEDILGNKAKKPETQQFRIKVDTLRLMLLQPRFGIFSAHNVDLIVQTNRNASCKFDLSPYFDFKTKTFSDMQFSFQSTSGLTHSYSGFQDYLAYFYLWCQDRFSYNATYEKQLQLDLQPPIIESAEAEEILELPLSTNLSVKTNEPTICKYSKSILSYSLMQPFYDYNTTDEKAFIAMHQQLLLSRDLLDGGINTFFVVCEDKGGLLSDARQVDVYVNTNAPNNITILLPQSIMNLTKFPYKLKTNKAATCYYGNGSSPTEHTGSFGSVVKDHESSTYTFEEGDHTINFKCSFRNGESISQQTDFLVDATRPLVSNVTITNTNPSSPTLLIGTNEIKLSWVTSENGSGIQDCEYQILATGTTTSTSSKVTIKTPWQSTEGAKTSSSVSGNFSSGKFYAQVRCYDKGGLSSDIEESNKVNSGITVDAYKCSNGILDTENNETDIDCGGRFCRACDDGKRCGEDTDCLNKWCTTELICQTPTCEDGFINGDETDTDCGGNSCFKCKVNKQCDRNADCETDICIQNKCAEADPCFNHKWDQTTESDIDCGQECNLKCVIGQQCIDADDCETTFCKDGLCARAPQDQDQDGILDEEDNCPTDVNVDQADFDGDGEGDLCDEDIDGDGITNDWEQEHGMNPREYDDRNEDPDGDGLTNYQEFKDVYDIYGRHSDPQEADTDGDGWKDGDEFLRDPTYDPTNPDDHPPTFILFILIVLFLILANFISGYYLYNKKSSFEKQRALKLAVKAASPLTMQHSRPMMRPMIQQRPTMQMRRPPVSTKSKMSIPGFTDIKKDDQQTEASTEKKVPSKLEEKTERLPPSKLTQLTARQKTSNKLDKLLEGKDKGKQIIGKPKAFDRISAFTKRDKDNQDSKNGKDGKDGKSEKGDINLLSQKGKTMERLSLLKSKSTELLPKKKSSLEGLKKITKKKNKE